MSKKKLILSIISANLYLPLLAVFYSGGALFELVLLLAAVIHTIVFAVVSDKVRYHILFSLNLMISFCAGSALSSWLYYNYVSSDPMTPVVSLGMFYLDAAVFFVIIATSATIKYTVQTVRYADQKMSEFKTITK